jgi:hypothetical protein
MKLFIKIFYQSNKAKEYLAKQKGDPMDRPL